MIAIFITEGFGGNQAAFKAEEGGCKVKVEVVDGGAIEGIFSLISHRICQMMVADRKWDECVACTDQLSNHLVGGQLDISILIVIDSPWG